jgi:hypothetical protein
MRANDVAFCSVVVEKVIASVVVGDGPWLKRGAYVNNLRPHIQLQSQDPNTASEYSKEK